MVLGQRLSSDGGRKPQVQAESSHHVLAVERQLQAGCDTSFFLDQWQLSPEEVIDDKSVNSHFIFQSSYWILPPTAYSIRLFCKLKKMILQLSIEAKNQLLSKRHSSQSSQTAPQPLPIGREC